MTIIEQYLRKVFQEFDRLTDNECMITMLKLWLTKYYPTSDWIVTVGKKIILPSFGDRYGSQFVYRYDIQQKMKRLKDFPLYCTVCGNDFSNEERPKFHMNDKDADEYDDDYPREQQEDYFYHYVCPVCGLENQLAENVYRKFYFYVNGTDYEDDEPRQYLMETLMRPATSAYQHKNISYVL